jgi:hypothetical protein
MNWLNGTDRFHQDAHQGEMHPDMGRVYQHLYLMAQDNQA